MQCALEHPILITRYGEMIPRYLRDAAGQLVVRSTIAVHPDIPYASHTLKAESPLFDNASICSFVEQWIDGLINNKIYCDQSVASIYHSGLPEVPHIFFPLSERKADIDEVSSAIAAMDACSDPAINSQIEQELNRLGIYPIPLLNSFHPKYFELSTATSESLTHPPRIAIQGWASAGHVYRKTILAAP